MKRKRRKIIEYLITEKYVEYIRTKTRLRHNTSLSPHLHPSQKKTPPPIYWAFAWHWYVPSPAENGEAFFFPAEAYLVYCLVYLCGQGQR